MIKKDEKLTRIVSYLTFDGHLAEDLKCFYLSSKRKEMLKDFEKLVSDKFNLKGRYEKGTGYGESYKYRVFNSKIAKSLHSIGTPKGSKVNKSFLVPEWIKENPKLSRTYLDVAFQCEGGFWKEGKYLKIKFGVGKNEALLENCKDFLRDLKMMLNRLGIETTEIWAIKGNNRKDGKTTKMLYFKVKQASIPVFLKSFNLSDRFKRR